MKSGNLNFLEPSGPLQACNGTALPLHFTQCRGGWVGPRAELDGLEGRKISRPCQDRNSGPSDSQTALLRIRKPYPGREIDFTHFHRVSLTTRLVITIPAVRNNKTIRQYTTLYYSNLESYTFSSHLLCIDGLFYCCVLY